MGCAFPAGECHSLGSMDRPRWAMAAGCLWTCGRVAPQAADDRCCVVCCHCVGCGNGAVSDRRDAGHGVLSAGRICGDESAAPRNHPMAGESRLYVLLSVSDLSDVLFTGQHRCMVALSTAHSGCSLDAATGASAVMCCSEGDTNPFPPLPTPYSQWSGRTSRRNRRRPPRERGSP